MAETASFNADGRQEMDDDHQPFPTLELVLDTIDVHVTIS
jgi:hypothetical protein